MELLSTPIQNCQLKFASEVGEFEGYASVFNSTDLVGDTIVPGAFKSSIESGRRIKMFLNHRQHDVPVGDWLEMREDDVGLFAKGRIDMQHKDGPTVYSALKRGAMDSLSIGFTMDAQDFERKSDGRIIKNLRLLEASIVSFPCEPAAKILAVKSAIEEIETLADAERLLRDAGFTANNAKTFVSLVKRIARDGYEAKKKAEQDRTLELINILNKVTLK